MFGPSGVGGERLAWGAADEDFYRSGGKEFFDFGWLVLRQISMDKLSPVVRLVGIRAGFIEIDPGRHVEFFFYESVRQPTDPTKEINDGDIGQYRLFRTHSGLVSTI